MVASEELLQRHPVAYQSCGVTAITWSLFRRLHQTRALISHYHRRGDPLPAELRM
jgi:hypothetical protein